MISDNVVSSDSKHSLFEEKIASIRRCTKVVKGGRNFSFSALVIVGDKNGSVGAGLGRAREVSDAIRKGRSEAKKNMFKVCLYRDTIPHIVNTSFSSSRVLIKPASKGTGIIAGGGVRMVFELLGVKDVFSKSFGSNNPINVTRAAIEAVRLLSNRRDVISNREKE